MLGNSPSHRYDLLLGAGESLGEHLLVGVKATGALSAERYQVTRPVRPAVRQTVFDARGKPVARRKCTPVIAGRVR